MIGLLRVELTRLRWRRGVLALVALAILLPAALTFARIHGTAPLTDADRAALLDANAGLIAECVQQPSDFAGSTARPGTAEAQAACEAIATTGYQEQLDVDSEFTGTVVGLVGLLAGLLLLVGATFAGHDWATGSITNQLLFEARRGRVWAAKAAAVTLVGLVVTAVVLTGFWVVVTTVVDARGLPPLGTREHGTGDLVLQVVRSSLLVAGAALGGFALTTLLRSTGATIGVLFAVAVGTGLALGALGLSPRWAPDVNLEAIVLDGTSYYVDVPERCSTASADPNGSTGEAEGDPACLSTRQLGLAGGVGYAGGLLAAVGAASLVAFRRRDV
ncbi:hypothetical protein K8Z61_03950 [Nocardioides sp. TRM66260-LWL]|uniref:hypothetical protein n=1 Tax=Nocardioides sp. TRM66260-LWL TaxID=2874478 RepID=UPI001CC51C1E|nr:hypothetical protein [Nocardioides sp. TRM66260-LWL]MBZ5733640.1 hypothetical protein [Nocardioides sp. TRM66260-LWL]